MILVYLACIVLVITLVLAFVLTAFDVKGWIAKDLKRGDLYSLIDVASGLRPDGLSHGQARRLLARGMVRSYGNGNFRATLKGRVALYIRNAVHRPTEQEN